MILSMKVGVLVCAVRASAVKAVATMQNTSLNGSRFVYCSVLQQSNV